MWGVLVDLGGTLCRVRFVWCVYRARLISFAVPGYPYGKPLQAWFLRGSNMNAAPPTGDTLAIVPNGAIASIYATLNATIHVYSCGRSAARVDSSPVGGVYLYYMGVRICERGWRGGVGLTGKVLKFVGISIFLLFYTEICITLQPITHGDA